MNVHSRPLKVAALGMEQRTYNTLQLFFSDRCDNHYVLSDEKSADLFIIDMDGYQASKVLEGHRKKYPHQPAILVSLKDNQKQYDSVFVRKPIQLRALASALKEAQKRIVYSRADSSMQSMKDNDHTLPRYNVSVKGVEDKETSGAVKNAHNDIVKKAATGEEPDQSDTANKAGGPTKVYYFANTERLKAIQEESRKFLRTFPQRPTPHRKTVKAKPVSSSAMDFKPGVNDSGIRFVGDLNAHFNPRNNGLMSKLQYNAEMTLQGYVSLAYKIALTSNSNVIVEGPWRPILILYKTKEICVERDFRHLFALSAMTFKKEEVSIYGREEDASVAPSDQVMVQSMTQFLWKLALRTSQGRVPQGTDLETPVKLIRWPNFTRCEITPHALRIAALWAKHPTSLVETAKVLVIPQQYVFAFYSATYATNLVTHVTRNESHELTSVLTVRSAHRSIFQNLLDRLRRI